MHTIKMKSGIGEKTKETKIFTTTKEKIYNATKGNETKTKKQKEINNKTERIFFVQNPSSILTENKTPHGETRSTKQIILAKC